MRKLAHIETIKWKRPIEGADRIELVGVLGWQCITKKDEFNVGDKCVYIEIDSIVDKDNPDFAFLETKKYKIKTQKMRGVLSQGIVFPCSILPKSPEKYNIGDDVTNILKIKETEDIIPQPKNQVDTLQMFKSKHKRLFGNKLFRRLWKYEWFKTLVLSIFSHGIRKGASQKFPEWIRKTDETRIQNVPFVLEKYSGVPMVVTEKLDGTSTTFGLRKAGSKFECVICSRNRKQPIIKKVLDSSNIYHRVASMFDIETVLRSLFSEYNAKHTVVLQGETIGEGIQNNKYKLNGIDFYGFNLIVDGIKIDSVIAAKSVKARGVKWVPILNTDFKLLPTVNEMLEYADGTSLIADTLREGLVIRDHANTVSFKCISNQFLLKHKL